MFKSVQFGDLINATAEGEWLGHSATTAENHYLHVIDADFERATKDERGTQEKTRRTKRRTRTRKKAKKRGWLVKT